MLKEMLIKTPLGEMIAIADDKALRLLEFTNRKALDTQIARVKKLGLAISSGTNAPLVQIKKELAEYFEGKLQRFQTPMNPTGTTFQKSAWQALQKIPYGKTQNYSEQASALNQLCAVRAVANANAKNPLAIIVPCHRVIRKDTSLGGYAAGLKNKLWLLEHERRFK